MQYSELCETYEELEKNSSRLKKTEILAGFLKKIKKEKNKEIIYLLQGKAFPDYDEREFGISDKLVIKALAKASGESSENLIEKWRKLGDLGLVAESVMKKKKQGTLFSNKLTTEKVLTNLQKLPDLIGKGTIDKKLNLISELLTSSSGTEAKYITRTLIGDLRIGVASGTIRDAISESCLDKNSLEFKEKKKELSEAVQNSYDKANDFSIVFEKACKGIKELDSTTLEPGHPLKVMLALKAESVEEGFKRVGKPAAIEYKYDGFRLLINKSESGEIKLFTRRLDNVTNQFPDVVRYVKEHINAKSFIIDSEAVGYDRKTKKYQPFQNISQRIKRKYHIDRLIKELPVEINVFDILYYNGRPLINETFEKRTELLRRIIKNKKYHLKTAHQLITGNEEKAEKFYRKALDDEQEGIMFKNLKSPYKPGARVGHMLKLKPAENELDLVITGAEYGTGKRVGTFSSFILSCKNEKEELLEIGKASTGLKEKSEGLSYQELTDKLLPLVTKEKERKVEVKPEIVVTIVYQNIQRSPNYKSGFALRFPRITKLRPDKSLNDVATLKEIKDDYDRYELKIKY
jgi:DNA ligase 1